MDNTTVDWNKQLNKAIDWCEANDWTVSYVSTKEDERADPNINTIFLSKRRIPEHQFYIFLHEIGHTRLFLRSDYEEYFQRYKNQKRYSTLAYKVLIAEEEVLAWQQGEKVARKQDWFIGTSYQFLKAKQLASYMNWVVARRTKEQILPLLLEESDD